MVARHVCHCPEMCVQPTLMRINCAQVMSVRVLCATCVQVLSANFAFKCAQCDFPVKCAPTLGHHVEEIHVEMQLRKWSPFSGATTSIQWPELCVCTNMSVVYSSCVGQMYPGITNLSDSKHALVGCLGHVHHQRSEGSLLPVFVSPFPALLMSIFCRSLKKVKFPTDQFRPALGSGGWLVVVNHAQKTSKLPYFRLFWPIPKYFLPLLPYTDLVPPSTDPVPPSTNQYRRILTQ